MKKLVKESKNNMFNYCYNNVKCYVTDILPFSDEHLFSLSAGAVLYPPVSTRHVRILHQGDVVYTGPCVVASLLRPGTLHHHTGRYDHVRL